MRRVVHACVLILLLACSARAGWMQNGAPEPQREIHIPPSPSAPAELTTQGEMNAPPLVQLAFKLLALF